MLATAIVALLAVCQAAAGPVAKRTTESVQLYAFGPEISGYGIYAGPDNLTYVVSDEILTNMTNMTALAWTIDTTGTNAWTVQPNTTATSSDSTVGTATTSSSSLASGSAFYVVTSNKAFEQAGFVQSTSDAPSGAVTTGFVTDGPYVMRLEEDARNGHDMLVGEFWAKNSSVPGVWALMWNEARTTQDNSAPVTLRTKAPIEN